jgi:ubiquinone/menaquinone biosynthesis C-methylase UbiE
MAPKGGNPVSSDGNAVSSDGNAAPTERQQREEDFHDQWAAEMDVSELLVVESFEADTALENQYVLDVLGPLRGKRVLELGCGAGEGAVYFALQGCDVSATDISQGMLDVAQRLAAHHAVSIRTDKMPAELLRYEDESFDVVYGNGVLHHVDFRKAIVETARVLRPGGQAVFIEPLSYNPVINAYRHIARTVRTEDERPFVFADLDEMIPHFGKGHHKEFWLSTLSIFLYFYLVERSDPSKERYWKKVIKDAPRYRGVFAVLDQLDAVLLKLPLLRYLCWNTVIVLEKGV